MIDVTIYKTNDTITGFIAEGHSDYAEEGFDIVCASVSILCYTALNSLNMVAEINSEHILYKSDKNTGLMSVKTLKNNEKTHIIYKVFAVGIEMLTEDYSEYITLKFEEV